jgi:hypothetical protein
MRVLLFLILLSTSTLLRAQESNSSEINLSQDYWKAVDAGDFEKIIELDRQIRIILRLDTPNAIHKNFTP